MSKIVTLIGSRSTPEEILNIMKEYVSFGNAVGYIFRSGGADGADSIVTKYAVKKEIYLPWPSFNGVEDGIVPMFTSKHRELVKKVHPAPSKLSPAAMKLHMRNINQIIGADINNQIPSDIVLCWTPSGEDVGGTRTAIVLARSIGIKILNLGNPEILKTVKLSLNLT